MPGAGVKLMGCRQCPGYITPDERHRGVVQMCNYFCWIKRERALQILDDNPEQQVQEFEWAGTMQSVFRVSMPKNTTSDAPQTPKKKRARCYCGTVASAHCGYCQKHCWEKTAAGEKSICGFHSYPNLMVPGSDAEGSVEMAPAHAEERSLVDGPRPGNENHTFFSRHIDSDWGALLRDRGYPVERAASSATAGRTVGAVGVASTSDQGRRRDRELNHRERSITLSLFIEDKKPAEVFNIEVTSKDWPMFEPRKYALILRACSIEEGRLEFFQKWENGLWIHTEASFRVQKQDHVVLRLWGVKICPGYQTKKRLRSSSTSSVLDISDEDQPSPTKSARKGKGWAVENLTRSPSPQGSSSGITKGIQAIDLTSDTDDEDRPALRAVVGELPAATVSATMLPPSSGRQLHEAVPGRTDNGWPFKWAVDQHECFHQVEAILADKTRDMKPAEAFKEVVPQAKRWVGSTWSRHYKLWKEIKNDAEHPQRRELARAIKMGRGPKEACWSNFMDRE
ncbi:hypothetical protein ARMGADRAFT_1092082 [Armillaria gallica]|uniref:Uncharacterized protein n=1 Tax=Armillaria gallica TaxID=47427 RepID=A0A2H3CBR4_ARMGA|nr:hypothetical protein ARMGADRAFT_1092082 [Armillaria gallica]